MISYSTPCTQRTQLHVTIETVIFQFHSHCSVMYSLRLRLLQLLSLHHHHPTHLHSQKTCRGHCATVQHCMIRPLHRRLDRLQEHPPDLPRCIHHHKSTRRRISRPRLHVRKSPGCLAALVGSSEAYSVSRPSCPRSALLTLGIQAKTCILQITRDSVYEHLLLEELSRPAP